MAIETWPESIFLQHGQDTVPDYSAQDPAQSVYWCPSQQTQHCIEYVRADLAPGMAAEEKAAKGKAWNALVWMYRRMRNSYGRLPFVEEAIAAVGLPSLSAEPEPKLEERYRGPHQHDLKTDPEPFEAVLSGRKTHEIRLNDRGFKVGDRLVLRETLYSAAKLREIGGVPQYTGRAINKTVSHIQEGYGLAPGWVILSFEPEAEPLQLPEQSQILELDQFGDTVVRIRFTSCRAAGSFLRQVMDLRWPQ